MPIEAALIKPVVDALMSLFRQGEHVQLQRHAEAALREAIRELLLANPDENKAAARIAIARAAGILSEDIVLAEDMLQKHRATRARTRVKGTSHKSRASATAADPAKPTAATKSAAKPSPKPASKPAPKKKPAAPKKRS
jgi:crotonobetainyl-CoA:carnitine CoA-transferase CaiB-like acyl-CoA transferase